MSGKAGHEVLYTTREELAHALTHGVGALLSLAGLVVMVAQTFEAADPFRLIAALVFGASLVALYTSWTLYHAAPWPKLKRAFQTCDHVAIFLLIAGSYTPFALVSIGGALGWTLFAVVWALAAGGTLFELITRGRRMKVSLFFYLAMGWIAVFFIEPLSEVLHGWGMTLLVTGGVLYTVGAVFYAWKRLPYNHAVWHLFVLAGSVSHGLCIAGFVLPS